MATAKITEVLLEHDDSIILRTTRGQYLEVRSAQGVLSAINGTPPTQPPPQTPIPPAPPTPPPAGPIDLGALPGELLRAIRMPAPPNIMREVQVWSDSDARLAASTAGTRLVVRANLAGIAVRAPDIEIQAGAHRCGMLTIARGCDRIAVHGGVWTGVDAGAAADVLYEGMVFDAPGYAFRVIGAWRVAILRCTGRAREYSVWLQEGGGAARAEDITIAHCRFDSAGPESTVRLTNVARAVVVSNRLANPDKHNLRVHGASDLVYAARNVLIGGGVMLGAGMPRDALGAAWLDGNLIYSTTPDLAGNLAGQRLTIVDNIVYRADGRQIASPRAGWVVERNVTRPYEAPPA